jgi:hypothetical protein
MFLLTKDKSSCRVITSDGGNTLPFFNPIRVDMLKVCGFDALDRQMTVNPFHGIDYRRGEHEGTSMTLSEWAT